MWRDCPYLTHAKTCEGGGVNPVLHFGDQILLPSWILTLSLSLSISLVWLYFRAGRRKIPRPEAIDVALSMMVGAVFGGRLFHVLYEQPAYYWEHPLRVFYIWEGGMVFFGALIGALLFAALWTRRGKIDQLKLADLFAPILAFTYAMGRIGCFLNGCCYGKRCDLPWAANFPHHHELGIEVFPRHPTQLYATAWEILVLLLLLFLERKSRRPGVIFSIWLTLHGVGRLLMEQFRDDDRGAAIFSLSIGSWISLILIGVGTTAAIKFARKVS